MRGAWGDELIIKTSMKALAPIANKPQHILHPCND